MGTAQNGASATTVIGTCTDLRVKLLGADSIPGAATTAGILVKVEVSSTANCEYKGYPIAAAMLSSGLTRMASDLRTDIFGGMPTGSEASAPLHSFVITSRARTVSFTLSWFSGNGTACPLISGLRFTLPGSRQSLVVHSIYEGGVGMTKFLGIYCGHLSVTPTVPGFTGKYGW